MESIKTKMDLVIEVLDDAFLNDKTISFPSKGTSMLPLLHTGDIVTVKKVDVSKLKKGDIILYKRDNGQYVLHRIRKIKKDGSLVIVGDHQRVVEKNVRLDMVIGIMISYQKQKNKKEYNLSGVRYNIYKLFIRLSIIRWFNGKAFKE